MIIGNIDSVSKIIKRGISSIANCLNNNEEKKYEKYYPNQNIARERLIFANYTTSIVPEENTSNKELTSGAEISFSFSTISAATILSTNPSSQTTTETQTTTEMKETSFAISIIES